ncbi:NIF3-like protein 1 isoform X1 [Panulirus ornatus]|uniref:NIF3-like protein 1 isoform X1 n=3 Tax=Panulirus ornatus TaxID=150431 RepID=UPI003A8779A3
MNLVSSLRQSVGKYLQFRHYSMHLTEVVKQLNSLAPTSLAESWDNVGLLVEPYTKKEVEVMLLTNDLTEEVMDEAEERGADFILSYHPPVFRPLKSITSKAWKERIVARCLEKGIAIYSPHTCYDALEGGVNDWLIQAFGGEEVTPLQPSTSSPKHSHQVCVAVSSESEVSALVEMFTTHLDQFHSFIRSNDKCVEVLCTERTLPTITNLVSSSGNASSLQLTITKLEKVPIGGHGMGRKCKIVHSMTIRESVNRVKSHLGLPHIRLALAHGKKLDSVIRSVAVCAGSGASVLRGACADLWLTGEMSHHEVLDANHQGATVILTDHSNSERGFLKTLQPQLLNLLDQKVEVLVSEKDRDPLEIV